MTIEIIEYVSDYTGATHWAVRVNGYYPRSLDFETRQGAEGAMVALKWHENDRPDGY
jgi:hypothetical protein